MDRSSRVSRCEPLTVGTDGDRHDINVPFDVREGAESNRVSDRRSGQLITIGCRERGEIGGSDNRSELMMIENTMVVGMLVEYFQYLDLRRLVGGLLISIMCLIIIPAITCKAEAQDDQIARQTAHED